MNKKNFLVNLLMILVFIALALGAYYLKVRIGNEKEKTARVNEQVVLKDIYYDSAVTQISYGEAGPIIQDFVGAYNNKNGEMLAQVMDLVATYIYSDCENESEFDTKYVDKLSRNLDTQELILMQYSLKKEETGIISGVENNSSVELTLIENSEITDVSKYLSKMTAKIRTVSQVENIDEIDTLEFLLLHRDGAYNIIKFEMIDSVPYTE